MEPVKLSWAMEKLHEFRLTDAPLSVEATSSFPKLDLDLNVDITGICIDTRKIALGDLFFALIGENSDGHNYVAEAFEKGAVAVVVVRKLEGVDGVQIVVSDTLLALGKLARAYRQLFDIQLVAITGSVGKTSTKEMLAAVLRTKFRTLASEKNYNNEIGVPLTLFQLTKAHEAAVIEMGMRGAGQIAYLAEMASPAVGIITNVGFAHIELLGSREAIAAAKGELLTYLPHDGCAILPAGEFRQTLRAGVPAGCNVMYVGKSLDEREILDGETIRVGELEYSDDGAPRFWIEIGNERHQVALKVAGEHHALNSCVVLAAAKYLQVPIPQAISALEDWTGAEGRMVVKRSADGMTILDDCYNAGLESMSAALSTLSTLSKRRSVAVLGDMKELGDHWKEIHGFVGHAVVAAKVTLLITVGGLATEIAQTVRQESLNSGINNPYIVSYPDSETAASEIGRYVNSDDTVLVKGSRAMQMEKIVAVLTGEKSATEGTESHG